MSRPTFSNAMAPSPPPNKVSAIEKPATPQNQVSLASSLARRWEKNAEISTAQNDRLSHLAKLITDRPVPHGLEHADLQSTPEVTKSIIPADMYTMHQFYEWYLTLEQEESQEEKYKGVLEEAMAHRAWCVRLLEQTEAALSFLNEISTSHDLVNTKTGALHQACQSLLSQEGRLLGYAQSVAERLAIFNELDRMTRRFNSQSVGALDDSFMALVRRLDECIAFMEANPNYKESPTYLLKFRLLHNRGLTLLKTHIVNALKTTTTQILSQTPPLSPTPASAIVPSTASSPLAMAAVSRFEMPSLFYIKFRALGAKLQPLCKELEARAAIKEYGALLQDCHAAYFQQRSLLLTPLIYPQVFEIGKIPDLAAMVRAGCSYVIELCKQEYQLYHDFFEKPSPGLRTMLEAFSGMLYDTLRPVYLHNKHLDLMCSLVDILRTEILEDKVQVQSKMHKGLSALKPIVYRMLQDIQERLIYLTQIHIRDEILSYTPSADDLDYPNKLIALASADTANRAEDAASLSALADPAQAQAHAQAQRQNRFRSIYATWYPTLQRTLMCLSKLYLTLDSRIFEGLASEAVETCIDSLVRASRQVLHAANATPLDAQLFLVKHLVVLQEQIAPFDIKFSFTERGVDFTHMRNAMQKILTGQNQASLFSFSAANPLLTAATPRITDSQTDAIKTLEAELKGAVASFVTHVIQAPLEPLVAFLTKANAFLNTQKAREAAATPATPREIPLWEQTWGKTEGISAMLGEAMTALETQIPPVLSKMHLYLPTHPKLLAPLKQSVRDVLEQLSALLTKHYPPHEAARVRIPHPDHLALKIDSWWNAAENPLPSMPTPLLVAASPVPPPGLFLDRTASPQDGSDIHPASLPQPTNS